MAGIRPSPFFSTGPGRPPLHQLFRFLEAVVLPPSDEACGVDLGLESFAATSHGESLPAAKYLRKAERNLKRLQRQVPRREEGLNRRKKAIRQLARAHLHVAN